MIGCVPLNLIKYRGFIKRTVSFTKKPQKTKKKPPKNQRNSKNPTQKELTGRKPEK